ncbi:cell division protein FtsA [Clostridium lundense]|uniref:cell division protein FtsA n=1 Tax=Clostridium lundense TaxID=319475 RepID=UPI000482489E|nr:cell division protein FtsA [Clostridium lundense]
MNEYVVGIDIGSSKVCAAAGIFDKHGKIQITGITSVPCDGVKRGIVVDIDNTAIGIKNCVEQLERMIDSKITEAYISIPGEICELTLNRGVVAVSSEDREIKKNDVERVLKAAKIISIPSDKEIIGVIPEQFIVDGYDNIIDPIGMCGLRLEVDAQIILCQSTIISNIFKGIKKAGINVNGMVFQPLANAEAVLNKEEMKIGVLLLDIGGETTNITVFNNNRLIYSDMLPIGGNTIANDISLCLKLPLSEAEKLKIKYGRINNEASDEDFKIKINANYDNVVEVDYSLLIQIISARVEEILYLVKKKLNMSGCLEQVSGIVVVGGGIALTKGSIELCKNIMDKPVRVGIPEYVGAASPIYATAVGIVKDVIETGKVNLTQNTNSENHHKRNDGRAVWEEEDDESYSEENNNGILSKIKGFFSDFF